MNITQNTKQELKKLIRYYDDKNIETARKRGWNVLKATGSDIDMIKNAINKFISE